VRTNPSLQPLNDMFSVQEATGNNGMEVEEFAGAESKNHYYRDLAGNGNRHSPKLLREPRQGLNLCDNPLTHFRLFSLKPLISSQSVSFSCALNLVTQLFGADP